jgi:hypothetical protein
MAKKDKQAKKDKAGGGAADAIDAIRSAIERGLEGAGLTEKRQREVVDQVSHAAGRIRQTLEELHVVDEVGELRKQVERLAARVAELEGTARTRATGAARAATGRSTGTTGTRSTGTRSTATRSTSTRAKPATTSRAKSSTTKSTGTRAKSTGTRAKSTSTRAKSSTTRARSTGTSSRSRPKSGGSGGSSSSSSS